MTVFATLDIRGLTLAEYRQIVDQMKVEHDPSPDIFLHVASEIDGGLRVNEIWDNEPAFESFVQNRLVPAAQSLGISHETQITVMTLVNIFAPRLTELPGLAHTAPAGPSTPPRK